MGKSGDRKVGKSGDRNDEKTGEKWGQSGVKVGIKMRKKVGKSGEKCGQSGENKTAVWTCYDGRRILATSILIEFSES